MLLFTRYSFLFYLLLLTCYSSLLSCYFLLVTRCFLLVTCYFSFVTRYYLLVTLYFTFDSSLLIRYHYFLLIVFFINFYYLLVKLWKLSDVKNLKISYHASNLNNGRSKEFQNLLYLSINNFKSSRNAVKLIRKAYVSPH